MITNMETVVMIPEFLLLAGLSGILTSFSLSPLGCIILWKRMAFLGEAIAHASILGIVLSLIVGVDTLYGAIAINILFSVLTIYLRKMHNSDTLIAIFSYGFLATGLLLISLTHHITIDISSYLFGDILFVTSSDIMILFILTIVISLWLWKRLRSIIAICINEDLARIEGINVKRIELEFLLLISIAISIATKILGVLLISSILIIPAATARLVSNSAKKMIYCSAIFALLAMLSGLSLSAVFDIPSGVAIIICALICYLIATIIKKSSM